MGAGPPDRDRPARVALDELLIEGLTRTSSIHQALLSNEAFLEGRMTTNLLDRVGSAAFLAAGSRRRAASPLGPAMQPCTHRADVRPTSHRTLDPDRTESPVTETTTTPRLRPTGPVHTTREIEALIPHRWPFLLVDRIVEYDPEASGSSGSRR